MIDHIRQVIFSEKLLESEEGWCKGFRVLVQGFQVWGSRYGGSGFVNRLICFYLSESVYKVAFEKSIPAPIRQLILHYY